ncbi:MAG: MoaD/ThiS family protein [Thermovirgaceae bacterium]
MRIFVRYHGPYRKDTGRDEETLLLADGASVGDALGELQRKYGASFTERKDGLVCVMEEGSPKAVSLPDALYEGALLILVGTVESG